MLLAWAIIPSLITATHRQQDTWKSPRNIPHSIRNLFEENWKKIDVGASGSVLIMSLFFSSHDFVNSLDLCQQNKSVCCLISSIIKIFATCKWMFEPNTPLCYGRKFTKLLVNRPCCVSQQTQHVCIKRDFLHQAYGTRFKVSVMTVTNIPTNGQYTAWRMVSSGVLRRVALVRTDVSDELSAFFIRVTRIGELGTEPRNISSQLTSVASHSWRCSQSNDSCHPDEGGTNFLWNVGSCKSHTA
jgi:hypothetical protein